MSFQNAYLNSVMDDLRARYAHEPEYLQAVEEFLEPLSPVIDSDPRYEQQNIVGRMASRSADLLPGVLGGRSGQDPPESRFPGAAQLRPGPL